MFLHSNQKQVIPALIQTQSLDYRKEEGPSKHWSPEMTNISGPKKLSVFRRASHDKSFKNFLLSTVLDVIACLISFEIDSVLSSADPFWVSFSLVCSLSSKVSDCFFCPLARILMILDT